MNPSSAKDYEIDILIGKIAAIYNIVHVGFRFVWREIVEKKPFEPFWDVVFFVIWILIPCLYLFSLHKHNVKLSRLTLRTWVFCFLFLCWSATDKFLSKPSVFWKLIFPLAFIASCMIIGVDGVARIKDPEKTIVDRSVKIPESYPNARILVISISVIITLLFTFTFMVFIGKFFCDYFIVHWPSLEKNEVLLFYIGMAICFYPSRILGTLIPSVLQVLFNRIWNLCVKPPTCEPQ